VYTYSSSNLGEAQWTAKATKAIGSLRMAAIRNATSDYSSPNLRKALPPIPIFLTILILGIQTQSSPIAKPSGGSCANYKQRRGFQRKSTKGKRQTANALAAAAETIKPTLYQIYMATWSESKPKSTVVQ
jgi:hypothetical protein